MFDCYAFLRVLCPTATGLFTKPSDSSLEPDCRRSYATDNSFRSSICSYHRSAKAQFRSIRAALLSSEEVLTLSQETHPCPNATINPSYRILNNAYAVPDECMGALWHLARRN